jgi:hypothetical protein
MTNDQSAAIPIDTLDAVLLPLTHVSAEDINKIRELVSDDQSFELESAAFDEFSTLVRVDRSHARELLATLDRLYFALNDNNFVALTSDDVRLALSELDHLPSIDDAFNAICNNLAALLAPISSINRGRHIARLELGFLQHAVSFSSFVDIRPRFSADRQTIEELLPIIQFQITTDGHDKDTSFVFQIREDGLSALEEAVGFARRKLDTVRAALIDKALLNRGPEKND